MRRHAFTIVELLVVVSIISLLVGILVPAVQKARDQAMLLGSQANLRNIAAAHGAYGAEWNDRQLTFIDDNFGGYGGNAMQALDGYHASWGYYPPPIVLGWANGSGGHNDSQYGMRYWGYWPQPPTEGNVYRIQPIVFEGSTLLYFGSFRIINANQFAQYVSSRFYDEIFYAPKDRMVRAAVQTCLDDPQEFCLEVDTPSGGVGWSSYVLSPAAMFAPDVMRNEADGGWQNPFQLQAAFRSPSFSQALYPDLKTHVLEHHWLQNSQASCNPGIVPGTYDGCEPYYFNHAWESTPMTLFYDGHIGPLGTRETMRADGRHREQVGYGLWSRDTPYGEDGYLSEYAYDQAQTSYHILTTDGIRGRDTVGK